MRRYLSIFIVLIFILALFYCIVGCKNKEASSPDATQSTQTAGNTSEYLVISKSSFDSSSGKKEAGFTTDQEYDAHKVSFNGKIIYKNDDNSLQIKKVFSIGSDKVALIEINSGGTACPAQYMFATAKGDGTLSSSAEFGTCSDIPNIIAKGDKITVKLPGNPPGTWIYQNGNVKKGI
jgi:hypothetical protein